MTKGTVVSPHVVASAAGQRLLDEGGSAVDAAVATALALTVIYPHNCALGGDLFAVLRSGGETVAVNASGRAPAAANAEEARSRFGAQLPIVGPAAVTVPGLVDGLVALHARGGRLPWPALFDAAVELAVDGFELGGSLAEEVATYGTGLIEDPGMRGVFAPRGRPLATGERVVQPALGRTLLALRDGGRDEFYAGETGRRLARGLQAAGSAITPADLAANRPEVVAPLRTRYAGVDVITAPPNSQGIVLLKSLRVLAELGVADPLDADADVLARVYSLAARERQDLLADPDLMRVSAEEILGDDAVVAMAADVRAGRLPVPALGLHGSGDTVAVVAADEDGTRVSLIQSVFHGFGAGLLEPETGILLHNRGCAFSLDPASPNLLRPGARPAHSLSPLLVEGDGVDYVLGTMGGKSQPQILARLLLRLLAGSTPAEAVGEPRWIVGGMEVGQAEDTIHHEADVPAQTLARLETLGMPFVAHPGLAESLGHAQAIEARGDVFVGASDPRADGRAGD